MMLWQIDDDVDIVSNGDFFDSAIAYWNDMLCPMCGCECEESRCKIKCGNCGYQRDCSDLEK